ncbi:hypothetical protein P3602_25665 [Vibrio parahaemolyticus]|uniref:hypothetical protein n=1 Tax=Vibrio parahaemolyticus TaxID=670 RepID=UPI000D7274AD|nr:hypothetical protein [Vibrio parahaemolyticus]EIA3186853.1 hypothetical protein [Vibrio parahaemolyticus]MCR9647317.1 hypothetical protein [Vibrio parahaemolyticus]MCR9798001.1 hypothetical protein [Vibrio parahaemolyticus]MDF4285531.1 hypothetical protein [Vibrio parahaemolyticus]MDF4316698.1 hypothetical protein [Vibrio parahaemolyticus]
MDKIKDQELIILKGHLILDLALTELYGEKISFYGKVNKLAKNEDYLVCSQLLLELNNIRNKLAHEFFFDIQKSGLLIVWAEDVLSKIDFTKYSKLTNRTKVIHAISALVRKIMCFLVQSS